MKYKTKIRFLSGNLKGRVHLKEIGLYYKGALKTKAEECGLDLAGSG
jgi:hypothetical protein